MPTYEVKLEGYQQVTSRYEATVMVKADTSEEAETKAQTMADEDQVTWSKVSSSDDDPRSIRGIEVDQVEVEGEVSDGE